MSCLNSGVYVTARVLFAMADKGDAPRWLMAVNKRQVPARAILLGSAFGFFVMLLKLATTTEEAVQLPHELLGRAHDVHLSVRGHRALPVSRMRIRRNASAGGAKLVAGGAAVAMLAVLVAMCFMEGTKPVMWASLSCLGVILVALAVRNAMAPAAARS